MGFSDALKEETLASPTVRPKVCKVELIRQEMDATDRAALDAAVADMDNMPTEVILRALNRGKEGPRNRLGRKVLARHRHKECPCFIVEPEEAS